MSTGGGGTVGSQFDDAGRITISNPGAVHEETFTYDNNGNLTSITSPSLPYHNRVYGYDALDRLEHAEGPWGVIDYTYDGVGNRLMKTVDSTTETYSYVPGSNIIDSVANGTDVTYTHDANGNITGINNRMLAYNQDNRLVSVEEDSVTLGEYTYNGLGQRIIKEAGGGTTVFHYDFDGNIIGKSDESGTFSREYLYRGSNRLAMVDVSSGDIYFYGNDHLGMPIILTDSTNTVVWEARYKPFGEAEVNPNSEVVSNFRFKGQYYDSETGFHYNYYRYYEPSTGRYLSPDPIGQLGEINLYPYVENNPISFTDPFGLEKQISLNITGVIAVSPNATLGAGASGGMGVGVSIGDSILDTQFILVTRASFMATGGLYAGIGPALEVANSDGPLSTVTTNNTMHAEINAGWGPSGGASIDIIDDPCDSSKPYFKRHGKISSVSGGGGRIGVGFGAMVGVGAQTSSILATPTLRDIIGRIKNIFN